ncbi:MULTISPECIES: hypothetical protein [Nocardia]|nr:MULTISPECIES: hypothetical protein [Nocardia]
MATAISGAATVVAAGVGTTEAATAAGLALITTAIVGTAAAFETAALT